MTVNNCFKIMFIYLVYIWCMCMDVCHRVNIEVRGQPVRIGSFLPSCGSWELDSACDLAASIFTSWAVSRAWLSTIIMKKRSHKHSTGNRRPCVSKCCVIKRSVDCRDSGHLHRVWTPSAETQDTCTVCEPQVQRPRTLAQSCEPQVYQASRCRLPHLEFKSSKTWPSFTFFF